MKKVIKHGEMDEIAMGRDLDDEGKRLIDNLYYFLHGDAKEDV